VILASLPESVVSASTVNSFKARLDIFWANEEIYWSQYVCTRSRISTVIWE